jgi:phosphatidylglycerol---prolipoprotein diacylglyceryl transferase
VKAVAEALKDTPHVKVTTTSTGRTRVAFDKFDDYLKHRDLLQDSPLPTDRLDDLARDWPRGKAKLELVVTRPGGPAEVTLPAFAPATVGLYPTQLYETVSMGLLILFLLAYFPFRRHDGQLMVFVMIGYAVHRFINESLRIEPSYTGGLTLSQWGSVVVLVAAVGMELYLWRTKPSRWKGEVPPPPAAPAAPQPAA